MQRSAVFVLSGVLGSFSRTPGYLLPPFAQLADLLNWQMFKDRLAREKAKFE
jgi:hypothetical protein